jgi:hypothetical protein
LDRQESSDAQRCGRMSIATFIKQDLIANIRSGKIRSDRLTLDALSKQYQVSAVSPPITGVDFALFDRPVLLLIGS